MVGAARGGGDLPIRSPPEALAGSGSTRRQVWVAAATPPGRGRLDPALPSGTGVNLALY